MTENTIHIFNKLVGRPIQYFDFDEKQSLKAITIAQGNERKFVYLYRKVREFLKTWRENARARRQLRFIDSRDLRDARILTMLAEHHLNRMVWRPSIRTRWYEDL